MVKNLEEELKKRHLAGISDETSKFIAKNSKNLSAALKKSKSRLFGLGDVNEVLTVEESVEVFNKQNGFMNDDEIKAWVCYKRMNGVPMDGWKKWFVKGKGGNKTIIFTKAETELRDKNFKLLKAVPANTKLGMISMEKTVAGWIGFTSPTGDFMLVNKDDVRYSTDSYLPEDDILKKMVINGYMFYNKGRYLPYAVYAYGNMYDREVELEQDKEFILETFGENVYDFHKSKINELKPKQLSFLDPVTTNRPQVNPLSEFAKNYIVTEFSDEYPGYVKDKEVNLSQGYAEFLLAGIDKSQLKYTNITGVVIYNICYANARKKPSMEQSTWELIKGRAYAELERLFYLFQDTCLTVGEKQRLDFTWNRRFNGFPSIQSNKVPIGLKMSKYVRGNQFELRPAQREGVAFMELTNSGCVSFDVGVGKTFTAIAELACAMSQGKCTRPIIAVPNSTYKNWSMEMVGNKDFNGLLSNTGIKINYWSNLGSQMHVKESEIADNTITLVTYEGLLKFGFSNSLGDLVVEDFKKVLGQAAQTGDARSQAKLNEKIESLLGRGQKGGKVDFDKCGFDYIIIDEAHNFKNVFSKITADTSKSRMSFHAKSAEPSDRGLKGFIFCNYIQRKFGGNVMLLTATPFTNTPLEIYSMLSFVAMDELTKRGFENIHQFFETFVNEEYDQIVDSSLNIRDAYVTKSFKNRIVLQGLIYSNFDYKTGEEAGVKRPSKINIPLLYKKGKMLEKDKQILSYIRMTERQKTNQIVINKLINNAGQQGGRGGDSKFSGMAGSLNNALSPFLFKIGNDVKGKVLILMSDYGFTPDDIDEINRDPYDMEEFINESPKIKFACECVKSVYEWHVKRKEECSGQVIYLDRGKEYFGYIKEYLEEICGFKRGLKFEYETFDGKKNKTVDEVEIIEGGMGEEKKDLYMKAFNAGVIKVIIGTSTIKEGVNLQSRSTVLYNLYPNWNPTDVQQLEGRIYRQGNKYQFVRIVLPLMQDSMDTFIFQKLQEKTDRINDIWYKEDRGNVLSVDSLDPKEVKFALITDISQLVKVQIKKEGEDAKREYDILEEEKKALQDFTYKNNLLKNRKLDIISSIRRSLDNMGRYVDIISNRPSEEELGKMTAENRNKIKKTLETYDELMRFINNSSFDDEKEIIKYSRTLGKLYPSHSLYATDDFADLLKTVAKIETSVLEKRGYDRNSDINAAMYDIKTEMDKIASEYKNIMSDEHYQEVFDYIVEKKKEMNIVGKSMEDRLEEFKRTNYVMQYPFDPLKVVDNNELPDENGKVQKSDDDEIDDIALLELEAEAAMAILLLSKKKSDVKKKSENSYPERDGDVTKQQLINTFGFNAVNLDWNLNEKETKELLNQTYDTFLLLAKVIDKPTVALGFGGNIKLNIGIEFMGNHIGAFYSRKKSLNYKAMSQFKHVGHEWFHALDHYLCYTFSNKKENLFSEPAVSDKDQTAREALRKSFVNIIRKINKSEYYKQSSMVSLRVHDNYWIKNQELLARAFEVYLLEKMKEKGLINDNRLVDLFESNPYPDFSVESDREIKDAFDDFFNEIKMVKIDDYKIESLGSITVNI
ncbi:MAG: SNF2-related protein [Paludibacteraceae bacterium]|nr:SNF2-related protein [Paludibacteraceae bacterium]